MTEQEFKTNYVKSYLAAYESVIKSNPAGSVSTADELLDTAKQYAERAWQQYLEENQSD